MNRAERYTTRHRIQLQEILLAMCIGFVLTASFIELTARVWRYSIDNVAWVHTCQDLQVLRRQWRRNIHRVEGQARMQGDALVIDDWRIEPGEGRILFHGPEAIRELALPRKTTAVISVERRTGETCCVLQLSTRVRALGRKQQHTSRIVACREEANS